MKLIFRLVFNALAVLLAAWLIPGIVVASFGTALLVAIVFALLNATFGTILKILTLPLSILTFGLFLLVINGLMFWAASFVKGFSVHGFIAAFLGSLIVTAANLLGKKLVS